MNRIKRKSHLLFIFVTALLILSCGTFYGFYKYDKDRPLEYNKIQITVDDLQTGGQFTNYYIYVKVKNIGNKEMLFDSGDLELVDKDSGLTFYSISKDKSSVSVPVQMSNLITALSLKPGRMIAGMLWFTTQTREATSKKLQLHYGNKHIEFIKK